MLYTINIIVYWLPDPPAEPVFYWRQGPRRSQYFIRHKFQKTRIVQNTCCFLGREIVNMF